MRRGRAAHLASYAATVLPAGCPSAPTVTVRTATQLSAALAAAAPGHVVALADGTYRGQFALERSGTPTRRIVVCGSAAAVLTTGSTTSGYVLHLDGADAVTVSRLSLRTGKNTVIERSRVSRTGTVKAAFGEGVYVGSAVSDWDRYSGGLPDRSDRNRILDNVIHATGAESIDIKEGTTGGLVRGNRFDGAGMAGEWAGSWVDVKGNGRTLTGNLADVRGPGYGLRIHARGDGRTNRVGCDDRAPGARPGLANVACTP